MAYQGSLKIILNNFVEINLQKDLHQPQIVERNGHFITIRLLKDAAPLSLIDSGRCHYCFEGSEKFQGEISECTCDDVYLYLKCRTTGKIPVNSNS